MTKQAILTLVAVVGLAISLVAWGQYAYSQGNPLLDWKFLETATVEDVVAAIEESADIEAVDSRGMTPLHLAALENGNPDVFKLLLETGAIIDARDRYGWTPLHYATRSWNSNPDVIALLLDRGADIEARTPDGKTPLHLAAEFNDNPDVLALLLYRGADIKAVDSSGKTPLDWATTTSVFNNPEVHELLRDRALSDQSD